MEKQSSGFDVEWTMKLEFLDEVEVFRRETELTLLPGENREISGCLQGAPSPFTRIFRVVPEDSLLSLRVQARA